MHTNFRNVEKSQKKFKYLQHVIVRLHFLPFFCSFQVLAEKSEKQIKKSKSIGKEIFFLGWKRAIEKHNVFQQNPLKFLEEMICKPN